uniref:Telomerase reverse transcriptase n=1 Tax=Dermatophagoides pteronyssinus TaxID=6956 RepID=A0A6P6XZN2_DERPT|nr:telomerase reverse transcriptase-like [Dermatophagoides pteronyssinus]
MELNKILKKHYSYHYSLMEILVRFIFSPEIHDVISCEFRLFLSCTFLVTNEDPSYLFGLMKSNRIDDDKLQNLIKRFKTNSTENAMSNMIVLNNLIGEKMAKRLAKNASIYHYNNKCNYYFLLMGKQLPINLSTQQIKPHRTELNNDWNDIPPDYRSLLNAATHDNDDNDDDDPLTRQLETDQKQEKRFLGLYGRSSPLNRADMLYSRQSSGRIMFRSQNEFPFIPIKDNKDWLSQAHQHIFGDKAKFLEKNFPYRIDEYLVTIYDNIQNTNFESILRQCCPLNNRTDDIVEMRTTFKQVNSFLYAIYYRIIPIQVLGSKKNYRTFYRILKELFTSCRITRFRIFDIINGMELDQMQPLLEDMYISMNIFVQPNEIDILVLCWLFRLLKQIVRSKFYVTESRQMKHRLIYYRYDLWAKLCNQTIRSHFNENRWSVVRKENLIQCKDLDDYLRYSSLRFIPKSGGLRPITRLRYAKQHSNLNFRKQISSIIAILSCLNRNFGNEYLQNRSYLDLYCRLKEKLNGQNDRYYIIRGDFQKCYPSINLSKLMSIILIALDSITKQWVCKRIQIGKYLLPAQLFMKNVYLIRQRKNYHRKQVKTVLCNMEDDGCGLDEKSVIKQLGYNQVRNCIINVDDRSIDGCKKMDTKKIIYLLRAYLFKTIISLGRRTSCSFTKHGIRQGSPLSTELCQIYLNYIWSLIFRQSSSSKSSNSDNDLFLSFADDFLFLSTDLKRATNFVNNLKTISPDYNLIVNEDKLTMNFDMEGLINDHQHFTVRFLGREFSLINRQQQLVIRIDYTGFVDQCIMDSFDCNRLAPLLRQMKLLLTSLYLHCYPEIFDCQLNPLSVVIDSIFQRILLQAMKFASLITKWQPLSITAKKMYFPSIICRFIYHLAKRLFEIIRRYRVDFVLSECHIHLIAAEAFRILWNTKLRHRSKTERLSIEKYCLVLRQKCLTETINLDDVYSFARKMPYPFDRIELNR